MRQFQYILSLRTREQGLHEVTDEIAAWVRGQGVHQGLLTMFVRHTSASILIQENADPDVQQDLESFFNRLAPEDLHLYRHSAEGSDDMPAHIKSALTQTQISIPVNDGRLALGRWQGIYLFEHRTIPRERELLLHLIGQ